MLNAISALSRIRVSSAANRFLYYARKLPFAGRLFPETFYANGDAKRALAVIAAVFAALWGFANKLAYAGLLVYWPAAAIGGTDGGLDLFLHLFLLLSFLAAGVSSATMLEPKREKYVAVKLMRMPPDAYMRAHLLYRYGTYFVSYVPALLLFVPLAGGTAVQGLLLAAALTLWRVCCEYAHLKLFEKTGMILIKNAAIVWLTIGAAYAAAYAPLFWEGMPLLGSWLGAWPAAAAIAAVGLLAAAKLARYRDYRTVVDAATRRDDPLLDLGKMMAESQKATVRTKASDEAGAADLTDKYALREGYDYLNALFFARHRSIMTTPVYKRLAIIAGVCAAGIAAVFGFDPIREAAAGNGLATALPYLILFMNFIAVGERACRAMFYNCDLSLMRYGFYRQAAGTHFRIRLVRLLGYNAPIGAAGAAALTAIVLAAGAAPVRELICVWLVMLSLSLFFSVHHLFLYYILQPYSPELNVRNPFYFLAGLAVSAGFGVCLVLEPTAAAFAAAVGAVTVVYLTAALLLVPKYAHRTFRVK